MTSRVLREHGAESPPFDVKVGETVGLLEMDEPVRLERKRVGRVTAIEPLHGGRWKISVEWEPAKPGWDYQPVTGVVPIVSPPDRFVVLRDGIWVGPPRKEDEHTSGLDRLCGCNPSCACCERTCGYDCCGEWSVTDEAHYPDEEED